MTSKNSTAAVTGFNYRLNHKAGYKNNFTSLHGSGFSHVIAQIAEDYPGIILVLLPDAASVFSLKKELAFFLDKPSSAESLPVMTLPDWETLPYDYFSPHQDIVSERLQTLFQLPRLKRGILLVPVSSALQKLANRSFIEQQCLLLKLGQTLEVEPFRHQLSENGYQSVSSVMEHGEFSVRGSIIDLFPSGSPTPIRIELFDNEIESLRYFDPDSQLTTEKVSVVNLLPAREYPTNDAAISRFRQQWRASFDSNLKESSLYRDVSKGIFPAGIEYYLPLFFEQLSSLFDYLCQKQLLVVHRNNIEPAATHFWSELQARYEQYSHDLERPILKPEQLFLRPQQLFEALNHYPQVCFKPGSQDQLADQSQPLNYQSLDYRACPDVSVEHKSPQPMAKLALQASQFAKTLICAESPGRQEVLKEMLSKNQLATRVVSDWQSFQQARAGVYLLISALQKGFVLGDQLLVCESDLFGNQVLQSRRRAQKGLSPDQLIHNLAELKVGDPVVHIDQGVGRYLGLEVISAGGMTNEFLTLEYSGGDKLYVPVQSLHMIHRFSGCAPELAPWHKLGSEVWSKAKQKAIEKARDTAAELLDLYARRAAEKGTEHQLDLLEYEKFAADFSFETTPDQQEAIDAVIADMKDPKPMDRLICGDVGFGKTEVAMRAAFVAVQSGMQVAMLVPTTLLAQQHFNSFQDRFAEWPVNVGVLSRFQSKKEQDQLLEQLAEGSVDIVIGTHRLLSGSPRFKNLGLLLIDEEHRFGVHQKETLKSYRAKVDILTLTATPIPRTLNMSLSGMRDLSIIATPPAKRLAIKTFVRQNNDPLIKEAVQREVHRGGQVYFLHNSVETIERKAHELRELVPDIEIAVAHGQMRERELEAVMRDFYHQRYHLLLCTTIIETGIDVPTANTIIIDRADKLGLAQLHQLRGRVGRSHHQAYAYLLTPSPKSMTQDAKKRLEAIESLEDLGAGFILATQDLEIRGAGELLGDEQSGHMQTIGFSLYMDLLERAVKSLKQGKEPALAITQSEQTEVNLGESAILPEPYIPDVGLRLSLYKRISSAKTPEKLRELQVELIDRFGLLPEPAKNLFANAELKLELGQMGITKLEANAGGISLEFDSAPQIDTAKLIHLIQSNPSKYKLIRGTQLKVTSPNATLEQRKQQVHDIISLLKLNPAT